MVDKNIRQHKIIAEGGQPLSGDFGVVPLSSMAGRTDSAPTWPKASPDSARHAPIKHSRGRLPAQANPDHGEH